MKKYMNIILGVCTAFLAVNIATSFAAAKQPVDPCAKDPQSLACRCSKPMNKKTQECEEYFKQQQQQQQQQQPSSASNAAVGIGLNGAGTAASSAGASGY
jgi:hypothetical protein